MSGPKDLKYLFGCFLALVVLFSGACSNISPVSPADTQTPFPADSQTLIIPTASLTAQPPTDLPAQTPGYPDVSIFPDPGNYTWSEVVSGLRQPVGLISAGDGSGRSFIIEQNGRVLIYAGGQLLESPFLDIRGRVGSRGSEQGLLGLAFHPEFIDNGTFFINYTDLDGNTVVSRFQTSSNPNQADGSSEERVLAFSQPYPNHNGGQISFGPEGYLWIASGDGGSGGDPQGNAQNLGSLLGKLLRIDVSQLPYSLPEDNPFGTEIWAYGLRNPWRFTFDASNGDLYIADVGQNQWEEIHYLPVGSAPGANFGWDYREGSHAFEGSPPENLSLIDPVFEYDHSQGCSISGGAVYRGPLPEWQGIYLYGDFCTGLVWGLLQNQSGQWQNQLLFQTGRKIAAIDQDEAGEIYLVDLDGVILRLTPK